MDFFGALRTRLGAATFKAVINTLCRDYLADPSFIIFFSRTCRLLREVIDTQNMQICLMSCINTGRIPLYEYLETSGEFVGWFKHERLPFDQDTKDYPDFPKERALEASLWLFDHFYMRYDILLIAAIDNLHLDVIDHALKNRWTSPEQDLLEFLWFVHTIDSLEGFSLFEKHFDFENLPRIPGFYKVCKPWVFRSQFFLEWVMNRQHNSMWNIKRFLLREGENHVLKNTKLILGAISFGCSDSRLIEMVVYSIVYTHLKPKWEAVDKECWNTNLCNGLDWKITRFITYEYCECGNKEKHNLFQSKKMKRDS